MMDWRESDGGGGGYFNENETTPSGKSSITSATRQQILCPVTIRQVHEAPDDGLKIGNFTATMVTLAGVIVNIDFTSTKIEFTLSDDTGEINCIEWMEHDDGLQRKEDGSLVENTYYQIYGCIKSAHGQRRIMIFKTEKIQNFNEYSAFMAEVISVNQYAEKVNQQMSTSTVMNENTFSGFKNAPLPDNRTAFNPIQQAILDEIKVVEDQIGWSRKTSALNNRFPKKAMEDALEFLISEGHIYSTIDDDHYCST